MATYVAAASFIGLAALVAWLVDRPDAVRSRHRRHWLRGDQWVAGKGWRKVD